MGPAPQLVPEPAVHCDRERRRRQCLFQAEGERSVVVWMQEPAERLTHQLGGGIGKEAVDRGTDEADHALGIGEEHDVTRVLYQRSEMLLAVAQCGCLEGELLA